MPTVTLDAGTIHYDKTGPADGRPVVFIHGYAMGRSLWRPLAERLSDRGLSCVAPTWPLGAHTEPMRADAELTMEGVAGMVGELLEALGLADVVLVGNDTGGAIAQIVAGRGEEARAAGHGGEAGDPSAAGEAAGGGQAGGAGKARAGGAKADAAGRLGALVLTSCDAFEHFPPPILKPLIAAAKLPPVFAAALQPLRTRFGRSRAFGALAHADIDRLVVEWTTPALTDAGVREDLRRFTASMKQESMIRAAQRLPRFDKPALIAWSADDAFFPVEDGRRLAATLPNARLEVIERSRTFSMIDQPDRLAELIAGFAGAGETGRAG
jgi:pimeloyl-ACP methyl ester carboxylesterase